LGKNSDKRDNKTPDHPLKITPDTQVVVKEKILIPKIKPIPRPKMLKQMTREELLEKIKQKANENITQM